MSMPSFAQKWLSLSSRTALLLGIGALSAGAPVDAAPLDIDQRPGQRSAGSSGDLAIWTEGGRICISESGGEPRELRLGDTAEARHLRELLECTGATEPGTGLRLDHTILAGGGGAGFHWQPPWQATNPTTEIAPTAGNVPAQPTDRARPSPRMPKASATTAGASRNAKD